MLYMEEWKSMIYLAAPKWDTLDVPDPARSFRCARWSKWHWCRLNVTIVSKEVVAHDALDNHLDINGHL